MDRILTLFSTDSSINSLRHSPHQGRVGRLQAGDQLEGDAHSGEQVTGACLNVYCILCILDIANSTLDLLTCRIVTVHSAQYHLQDSVVGYSVHIGPTG